MTVQHILLCGERGVGKSTLIRRLLAESHRPLAGFFTKRLTEDENGFYPIYIHPANGPWVDEAANQIGSCDSHIHRVTDSVFNTLGVAYLNAPPQGLIVMDELGFMEAQATDFVQAVFAALDGNLPVLAAVKARDDVPFLNQVRTHAKARCYEITPENRDNLYETLLPLIREWNSLMGQ